MRDFTDDLSALGKRLDEAGHYLGLDGLRTRLAELEAELGRPDLWDDTEVGQRVTREYGQTKADIDLLDRLRPALSDAETLYQLAVEEDDDSVEAELEGMIGRHRRASSTSSSCGRFSSGSTTRTTPCARSMPRTAAPTPRTGPR